MSDINESNIEIDERTGMPTMETMPTVYVRSCYVRGGMMSDCVIDCCNYSAALVASALKALWDQYDEHDEEDAESLRIRVHGSRVIVPEGDAFAIAEVLGEQLTDEHYANVIWVKQS